MGRGVKRSGTRWERELAKLLSKYGEFRRIPGSGSMAYHTGMSSLEGDVGGKYPWWRQAIRIECKYGYGTNKSMSVKREWIQKIIDEADRNRDYPAVALKFRDVMSGEPSAKVIMFPIETWNQMMKELQELWDHLLLLEERMEL